MRCKCARLEVLIAVDSECYCLMGCDAAQSRGSLQMFSINILSQSSGLTLLPDLIPEDSSLHEI
jgi:hypothetical protein